MQPGGVSDIKSTLFHLHCCAATYTSLLPRKRHPKSVERILLVQEKKK